MTIKFVDDRMVKAISEPLITSLLKEVFGDAGIVPISQIYVKQGRDLGSQNTVYNVFYLPFANVTRLELTKVYFGSNASALITEITGK